MLLNAFKKNQLQIFDGHRQLVIDSESFYFDGHYLCCSFYFNANHRPYFRNGWQSWERPGLGAGLPGLPGSCKSGYPAQCRGKWSSVIQELSQAASGSLQPLRPGQRCWALGGQPIRAGAASGGARCSGSDWVRSANGGTRIYLTTLSSPASASWPR